MNRELLQQALDKFEKLWEIGIDVEYKVELLPEIRALREELAKPEQALDKKADNARELGLDYEPNHGFDRTASHMVGEYVDTAEQEPVAWTETYDQVCSLLRLAHDTLACASLPLRKETVNEFNPDWDMVAPLVERVNELEAELHEYKKQQNVNTSKERVQKSDKSIHEMQRLGQVLEQEPVAWLVSDAQGRYATIRDPAPYGEEVYEPLYAAPPRKEWISLDETELIGMTCECVDDGTFDMKCAIDFANAIEAKLKEKNHD
jgi:hypothetical protein